MFRWHVVSAVFWRNVKQYFSGILGYLFIVVFVTVCAVLAFSQQFFADNLANLDQLSRWFPYLLLVFVPAITMTVWADERKSGTDAILFTLPASDFEIMLGKYLSVAMVYTIALFFSLTQLIALSVIGAPDWGVIVSTYFGYWLIGLAFLSIGMFASSLTSSPTISFVIGTILCAFPVFVGMINQGVIWLERLGVAWNLQDFTEGLIPLGNVVYFVSIIVFMLYLNLVVISQRHWNRGQSSSLASHYFLRTACLALALVCCNFVAITLSTNDGTRVDLTSEKLFTLDQATIDTIKLAKENERPITIQAFVSKEVPRKYVNAKKQFLGLLRQYDFYGGSYVNIRYVNVTPNSPQEAEALKSGVRAVDDRSEVGGRTVEQQVFLGALVSSPLDDVTLPVVDENTAVEYELTRSIAATADKSKKLTLGILDTDTHFGCRMMTGEEIGNWWAYSTTLKRLNVHFDVKQITQFEFSDYAPGAKETPANPLMEKEGEAPEPKKAPDVLIVADPSSLTQTCNDALIRYMDLGNPVIILADPIPFYLTFRIPNIGLLGAPRMDRLSPQNRYSQFLSSAFEPKAERGTAMTLLKNLGVQWDNGQVAWNLANPHPNYAMNWPEEFGDRWPSDFYGPYDQAVNFVRPEGDQQVFNSESPITSGLRELMFFYPGTIKADTDVQDVEFTPLVSLGTQSGTTDWSEITFTPKQTTQVRDRRTGEIVIEEVAARNPITQQDIISLRGRARNAIDESDYTVAAHIRGKDKRKTNVVFIADTDFLSEMYYEQEPRIGKTLDNFVFLLNAIEVLVGDQDFVSLRNRRPILRTLTGFEKQVNKFRSLRAEKTAKVETRIRKQRDLAEQELIEAGKEIREDDAMGLIQQAQMFSEKKSDALERLRRKKKQLNELLESEIQVLKSEEKQKVSALESRIRWLSVLLAPVPALLLGISVLSVRSMNERRSIDPRRRIGGQSSLSEEQ